DLALRPVEGALAHQAAGLGRLDDVAPVVEEPVRRQGVSRDGPRALVYAVDLVPVRPPLVVEAGGAAGAQEAAGRLVGHPIAVAVAERHVVAVVLLLGNRLAE